MAPSALLMAATLALAAASGGSDVSVVLPCESELEDDATHEACFGWCDATQMESHCKWCKVRGLMSTLILAVPAHPSAPRFSPADAVTARCDVTVPWLRLVCCHQLIAVWQPRARAEQQRSDRRVQLASGERRGVRGLPAVLRRQRVGHALPDL
jgi:hypothetical protein